MLKCPKQLPNSSEKSKNNSILFYKIGNNKRYPVRFGISKILKFILKLHCKITDTTFKIFYTIRALLIETERGTGTKCFDLQVLSGGKACV
jgi:hypothetical protein